jgi:hypothetical protein
LAPDCRDSLNSVKTNNYLLSPNVIFLIFYLIINVLCQ